MKKIFYSIQSTVIWFLFGASFVFWFLVMFIAALFTSGRPLERIGRMLCRTGLFLAGIRVRREGWDTFDPGRQYIVMMNHINLFDPFIFNGFFPGRAFAFQAAEYFRWPLYGWIMTKLGHIPINRKNPRKALEELKKGPEIVRSRTDFSLIIFPEGTRSASGKLGVFKRGAFMMALEAGVDILPLVQIGAYEINKRTEWHVHPGVVRVVMEKPIPIQNYSRETVEQLMKDTREVFLKYVEE